MRTEKRDQDYGIVYNVIYLLTVIDFGIDQELIRDCLFKYRNPYLNI